MYYTLALSANPAIWADDICRDLLPPAVAHRRLYVDCQNEIFLRTKKLPHRNKAYLVGCLRLNSLTPEQLLTLDRRSIPPRPAMPRYTRHSSGIWKSIRACMTDTADMTSKYAGSDIPTSTLRGVFMGFSAHCGQDCVLWQAPASNVCSACHDNPA